MDIDAFPILQPTKKGSKKIVFWRSGIKNVTFGPHMEAPDAPIPANCTESRGGPIGAIPSPPKPQN